MWAGVAIVCVIIYVLKSGQHVVLILGGRSCVYVAAYSVLFCMFDIGCNFLNKLTLIKNKTSGN